jgi:hypothetical protein
VDTPAFTVPVPDGWAIDSLTELRAAYARASEQATGSLKGLFEDLVDRIDQHTIVGSLTAPESDGPSPDVTVSVETGDATLAAAADRRTHYLQDTGSDDNVWTVVERADVSLPIGPAIRVVTIQDPAPGVPTQSVEYVVLVDDHTVSIQGTAPSDGANFTMLMEQLAEGVAKLD